MVLMRALWALLGPSAVEGHWNASQYVGHLMGGVLANPTMRTCEGVVTKDYKVVCDGYDDFMPSCIFANSPHREGQSMNEAEFDELMQEMRNLFPGNPNAGMMPQGGVGNQLGQAAAGEGPKLSHDKLTPSDLFKEKLGFLSLPKDYKPCRGSKPGTHVVDIRAGVPLELTFFIQAPKPGDCALYISYDGQDVHDDDKLWALIWKRKDCLCYETPSGPWPCSYYAGPNQNLCHEGCPQLVTIKADIPEWLPAAGNVVFHWEWYSTVSREPADTVANVPEELFTPMPIVALYSGCFDGSVIGSPMSLLPNELRGLVSLAQAKHLPQNALEFRSNTRYNDPDSFPPMVTAAPDWGGPAGAEQRGAPTTGGNDDHNQGNSGNPASTAQITAPATAYVNQIVLFNGAVSGDTHSLPKYYSWEFGDGQEDESGPSVQYAYKEAGKFRVSLRVYDEKDSSIATMDITIQEEMTTTTTTTTTTPAAYLATQQGGTGQEDPFVTEKPTPLPLPPSLPPPHPAFTTEKPTPPASTQRPTTSTTKAPEELENTTDLLALGLDNEDPFLEEAEAALTPNKQQTANNAHHKVVGQQAVLQPQL